MLVIEPEADGGSFAAVLELVGQTLQETCLEVEVRVSFRFRYLELLHWPKPSQDQTCFPSMLAEEA